MSRKNLVLELNAKMLFANQIVRFLNFDISKTAKGIKLIFCMQVHIAGPLKLQADEVILHECSQACSGMPKEAIKTLRSQKLK